MGNQQGHLSELEASLLAKYNYKSRESTPYSAAYHDGILQDSSRNKALKVRVHYPRHQYVYFSV